MKNKITLNIFIRIGMFAIISWICNFNNYVFIFNKSLDRMCNYDRETYTRNYRLLSKYKEDNDSNNLWLKGKFPNNEVIGQKITSTNEGGTKRKNNQSYKCSLNKAQYYTEVIDYNNGMFDGKHFHFQKKWVKKKDYDTSLEKKNRIGDISLKKIKFRSYKFGIAILLVFFLLGIGLPVSSAFGLSDGSVTEKNDILSFLESTLGLGSETNAYILLFLVTFIMLAVLIIIAIYKILRNNEKYQKIKLMME
ncbi:fam-m protein [Plasmodium malariae]|uniref:Fam-m protein n=1 Tax=Plasmodium malariae TaxID=5858 RepID=A0A1D3JLW1_PLAMA|nr:fam-m protein [Plasmodium malariae]SBT87643.1 fam-m protein [Plasmodium malariae]